MAISRMQMNRQLRAGGGIMDITPREKFGLGSKLKRAVRKIIPNEVASVASAAAPFVAPFNPLLAAGMAGVGSFDKSGSISGALRSGALTYGLGNLARVVGGAGFQAGLTAPTAAEAGFGRYFTSPMGAESGIGKILSDRAAAANVQNIVPPGAGDPAQFLTEGAMTSLEQLPAPKTTLGLLKQVVSPKATLGQRTQAIKDLGGKALKAIYTKQEDGKTVLDKTALAATIGGVGSYIEAKKLAEEADLVDDADGYTEEMYEADKAKYAEKYGEYLTPEAFGLKEGGRVKLQSGSEPGGIPSIMLEKKDYNFMDLIDEDAEEEYYKKKAEELDRKYNPQNYNDIIPKEKPMDQYMLNEIMSERGMNTLSEEARDDAMKMYAERAYKKGQISEDEYREIMGFKVGGRVGYKDAGFTTVKDLGIEREELGFPYDKSEYNLEDVDLLQEMPKVVVMDKEGKTRIVPENVAERLGLNVIMDSFDTEKILRSEKKADGGIMGVRNKYAMGSEVPIRENQAGVSEMDFRQTGGFVPPIGVKEKADDIPAMLSNNEFVFTADAVRAAGGGSVNKGAQKMYNLMKSLENKVV